MKKRWLAAMILLPLAAGDAEGRDRLSLAGPWQFRLEGGGTRGFEKSDFDASDWGSIPVPAHWELHGFGTPSYNQPSDEVGLYRKVFEVPPRWREGRRIFIHFESVYNGCEVFLNGRKIGYHEGGHTPFDFELTPAIDLKGENLLALRVIKKIPHWNIDNGDFWQLGGIYRRCELFAVPERAAIMDYAWETPPGENGLVPSGEVRVRAALELSAECRECFVEAELLHEETVEDTAVARVAEGADPGQAGVEIHLHGKEALPWTAETPNLYRLRLRLKESGGILQEEECPLGFRVCTARDGILLLNGRPVTLRGTGALDIWPGVGRAVTRDLYGIDVRLMKEANINTLRPGWTGCGEALLEIADREGLYIIGEAPFSNVSSKYLDDPAMAPEFMTRVQEAVHFLKRHPSVILYSVGNENSCRAVHPPLVEWIRRTDPTRPILLPKGEWASLEIADLVSFHYSGRSVLDHIAEMEKREEKKPLVYTEYNHGLWDAGGGLEQMWEWMRSSPLVAGGCQFAWCDQGLRYEKDGETLLDSQGVYGTDGLVTSDREPQAEYYQLKETYCPACILEDRIPNLEAVILTVENRHDFTGLEGFCLAGEWVEGNVGRVLETVRVDLPEVRPGGRARILMPSRTGNESAPSFLILSIMDPEGRCIGRKSLSIDPAIRPTAAPEEGPALMKDGDRWTLESGDVFWILDGRRCRLLEVRRGGRSVLLAGPEPDLWRPRFPHMAYRQAPDTLMDDAEPLDPEVTLLREIRTAEEAGGLWQVVHRYRERGWPEFLEFRAGYRITADRTGHLDLRWAHTYTGRSEEWLRRWGVRLDVRSVEELRYHGRGPEPSYPDKWIHQLLGCHFLDIASGRTHDNRQETSRILLEIRDLEGGLAMLCDPPAGLRIATDEKGWTRLHLATRVLGIGNKAGYVVQPVHRVVPAQERVNVGRVRLACLTGEERISWTRLALPEGGALPPEDEGAQAGNPLLFDSDGDGFEDGEDPDPLDADAPRRRAFSHDLAKVAVPPGRSGEGWIWIEAEDALGIRGGEIDDRKKGTTSGGRCLGGFRAKGDGAVYLVSPAQAFRNSRILLRYARQVAGASRIRLLMSRGSIVKETALDMESTGGWGYQAKDWRLASVPLGPLEAGPLALELHATRGPNRDNLNLDGFYLHEEGVDPPQMESEREGEEPVRFEARVPMEALTRGSKSHWFGYYDKLQFSPDDRYVLGMEVDFDDRAPRPGEAIRLGMVDRSEGNRWIGFGETRAWCWQQGCMLQWLPGSKSEVIFNDLQEGRFVAVVRDVFTGRCRTLPRPVYTVSPDGRTALCINFARLDRTRPGYGYAGLEDPYEEDLHPGEDGIFRMDLDTGESNRILSLDRIASLDREIREGEGQHYFNHLLFNPDGSRFIFLHRWYRQAKRRGGWLTRMFTAAPDGSGLFCVDPYGRTSHFIWRDPRHILCWTWSPGRGSGYHLFTDRSGDVEMLGEGVLSENGHMTYSPDGRWVLTDTYPDQKDRMMTLLLFRPADGRLVELGRFHLDPAFQGQVRCDLHPRWSRSGRYVCIDSLPTGRRQMYLLDVAAIVR